MPSSRDLLLARHRAVEPRLDALRADVLARMAPPVSRRASPQEILRVVWRELVAPCRPAWMTLAAVWVVLLVLNGAGRSFENNAAPDAGPTLAVMAQWLERRRVLAELAVPAAAPARQVPAVDVPGHSQLSPAAAANRVVC